MLCPGQRDLTVPGFAAVPGLGFVTGRTEKMDCLMKSSLCLIFAFEQTRKRQDTQHGTRQFIKDRAFGGIADLIIEAARAVAFTGNG